MSKDVDGASLVVPLLEGGVDGGEARGIVVYLRISSCSPSVHLKGMREGVVDSLTRQDDGL